MSERRPDASSGWVAAELREEFPGLALRQLTVERGSGRSTREVKERLRVLSDRFTGGQAINLRHQPIPWAYRVFFRHIGLDPDEQRTPVEELALERMKHGGFRSQNLLDDALTIAIVESGRRACAPSTPTASRGRSGSAPTAAGRGARGPAGRAPGRARWWSPTRERPLALLFGALAPRARGDARRPSGRCWSRSRSAACPAIAVEEALWLAAGVLRGVRMPARRRTGRGACLARTARAHRRDRPDAPPAPASAAVPATGRAPRARATCGARSRGSSASSASCSPRPSRAAGSSGGVGAVGGPRMLSTGELERVRDALAARLRDAQAELARRADVEEAQPRPARADDRRARASTTG